MVRETLKIKTDNGLGDNNPAFKDIELTDYVAKFPRMGFPELTATLMWAAPLDDEWTGNEYVVIRGEKFYIDDTPHSEKSNGEPLWEHEIEFTSEFARILGNTYFEDAVPSHSATYDKPCTNNSTFKFYGTIAQLVDRLNCSFLNAGIGDSRLQTKTDLTALDTVYGDGYCVMLDQFGAGSIYDPDKSYEFSWEDKSHWEAISESYTITEIPFERKGKKIIFGAMPTVAQHKFEYGYDNELLSIKHRNAKAKVINRITMLGSSENIPYYYPNETEYGHISIAANEGNKVLTAGMIEIANMTQLLSRLNADTTAVLGKYAEEPETPASSNEVSITQFLSAFNEESGGDEYTLKTELKYAKLSSDDVDWFISIFFTVPENGHYICYDFRPYVWRQNQTRPTDDIMQGMIESLKLSSAKFVSLTYLVSQDEFEGKPKETDSGIDLGQLAEGGYKLVVKFTIKTLTPGNIFFCSLDDVKIKEKYEFETIEKTGYYWAVGEKKYDGTGALGVKINGTITDDMIGDGFGWVASGRMPFQTSLVPPKYRSTLGAERFYNALNGAYIDPDTNSDYVFPNPFINGKPSEYIHRNEDIKPTIEGVRNAVIDPETGLGQLFGEIADIAFDAGDNDVLKPDSTEDNDKNDSLKYEHSYFYIKLNIFNGEYGFDLFKHYSQTDPMTVQMLSGSCNGCKFKIQAETYTDDTGLELYRNPVQTTEPNGNIVAGVYEDKVIEDSAQDWQQNTQTHSIWICVQKDASTFGVLMPNQSNIFLPKVGDKFNIINIDLPQGYMLAAEKRLEDDGIRFMADNNEEKFTFDIQASRIFLADNPQVLAELDEYSMIKVKYNGKTYEQYVNQLTIECKDSEALPNIGIELTDTLAVGQSFVEQVAERASSLISNAYTTGGAVGGGSGGGLTARLADLRYLSKRSDDRSKGKIASDVGFEIGEFISGGSGGLFVVDSETGQTYIEVDKLKVRMKAIFDELEISKTSAIGGRQIITPGGAVSISFVEELDDAYRCYFKAKEESQGADCLFVVGDQVQCEEFNISAGTSQNASNRYYWRLVTEVNNEESYVDLSKTDCDHGSGVESDEPMAGDTIVQLGNRNNPERQSAIVLSTVDAYAPCVTLYNGINNYSLDGKAVVEYGVDKSKNPPEPFFNCYGRFYYGPKGGDSYLKYEPSIDKLIFSGELVNISTLNGKDIDQYIKDVVPPVTQEDIESFVNAIVDPQIENIQNQIDGVIETWFYNGVPALSNYPANGWNTDALKIQHLGDLYYDNDTGTAYRFSQDNNGGYYWNTITDDAITKALAAAQKAQETANGKRRVFTSQPTPPYQQGDLWVNATYGNQYNNDILRCLTAKSEGQSFAIGDWGLASKYTDDSALNTFKAEYQTTIGAIKTQLDGKAQTWYQATDPSTAWTTADMKALHEGDLWYCTADIANTDYKKGTTWYWNGTAWQKQDIPQSVFDAIDGKATIFVSKPTDGYHKNDLWFLETEYTLSDGTHKAGTLAVALYDMVGSWEATDWAKKDRYTDDTLANQAIADIAGYKYIKESLINGASTTNGGLILSSLVKLGKWDLTDPEKPIQTKVWAGMNGLYNHDKTIASWWGGDMVDKFYKDSVTPLATPLTSGYAKALVRMDGSAYFAGGNIGFEADGSGWLGNYERGIRFGTDGSMTFGSGIKIDLNSGTEGLKDTLESLLNSVLGLTNLFTPLDADGTAMSWADAAEKDANGEFKAKSLRASAGLWSTEYVSTKGASDDSGASGGGIDVTFLAEYLADNGYLTASSLDNYVDKTSEQAIGGLKTFTSNQTTITRRAEIKGTNTEYDAFPELRFHIPNVNYSRLKMDSAGTVHLLDGGDTNWTSYKPIKAKSFVRNGGASTQFLMADGSIRETSVSGNYFGAVPYIADSGVMEIGKYIYFHETDADTSDYSGILTVAGGVLTYNDYTVLHSGNYTTTLDTQYVRKWGDTMTGNLLFSNSGTATRYIQMTVGDNDYGRIAAGATASNGGWLEIATADDGTEPIYARQYSGVFTSAVRTATLLDGSGNTAFPGVVNASYFTAKATTLCTNLNADLLDGYHETGYFRNSISTIDSGDILTTLPGNRSGSYIITSTGWNGSATVFYNNSSNSGLAFYRPGGSNSIPQILVALDGTSNWTNRGTILTSLFGNAVSATKLQTARTLWGQSFDGTANVSGNMTGVGNITPISNNTYAVGADGNGFAKVFSQTFRNNMADHVYIINDNSSYGINLRIGTGDALTVASNLNVGIGTATPAYTLDVNGTIRANGRISTAYDMYAGSIELSTTTPYIDFHFNNSTADYTSRIIEDASGQLRIYGKLKVGTATNTYALNAASFLCDTWVRTTGSTGWYNETYAGGLYMSDSIWIRNYGNKSLYMTTATIRTDGRIEVGNNGSNFLVDSSGNVTTIGKLTLNMSGENIVSGFYKLNSTSTNPYLNLKIDSLDYYVQAYSSKLCMGPSASKGISVDSVGDVQMSGNARIYGNLSLHSDENYGNRLSFGDGDLVYLEESDDDELHIYADCGIYLDGSSSAVNISNSTQLWFDGANGSLSADTANRAIKCSCGFYSTKFISAKGTADTSDMRFKRVVGPVDLTVAQIAEAPLFTFEWRDEEAPGAFVGTSAQYWEKVLPQSVIRLNDRRHLFYGELALAGSIVNSRAIERMTARYDRWLGKHETRVQRLERRIKELEKELETLKNQYNYATQQR